MDYIEDAVGVVHHEIPRRATLSSFNTPPQRSPALWSPPPFSLLHPRSRERETPFTISAATAEMSVRRLNRLILGASRTLKSIDGIEIAATSENTVVKCVVVVVVVVVAVGPPPGCASRSRQSSKKLRQKTGRRRAPLFGVFHQQSSH